MLQFVEHHVQAEEQLRQHVEPSQRLDRLVGPVPQPGRRGDPMLEQERLDLLLGRA